MESNPDFVISDDLLSPEDETRGVHALQQVDSSGLSSATVPGVASVRSLENILLDASPMEESIDLGSESILLEQSFQTTGSSIFQTDGTVVESNSQLSETEGNATLEDKLQSEVEVDDSRESVKQVHFMDIVMTVEDTSTDAAGAENEEVTKAANVLGSVNVEEIAQETSALFSMHDSQTSDVEVVTETAESRHNSIEDAVEVGFVEEKGIHTTASSRSLSRFFIDSETTAGGTDAEGKSFFDSFTAGEDEPSSVALSASPRLTEQSGSLSPATCLTGTLSSPRVSLTGSSVPVTAATNSPTRRISESSVPAFAFQSSLTREESISSTTSDSDPFSSGLFSSDVSRRHDAWIPSDATCQILMSIIASTLGASSGTLPSHNVTRPYVILAESLV
jgi:hypothetical protein